MMVAVAPRVEPVVAERAAVELVAVAPAAVARVAVAPAAVELVAVARVASLAVEPAAAEPVAAEPVASPAVEPVAVARVAPRAPTAVVPRAPTEAEPTRALTAGDGGTAFWAAAYNANCAPSTNAPSGHTPTNQTLDCLICHKAGGAAASKPFIFGGVVWTSTAATAGAPKVEVGVRAGSNFLYACSDTNGFFWVPTAGNTAPTWTTAEIRIRSSDTAEKKMNTKSIQLGTCNGSGCHAAVKLVKP